MYVCFCWLLKRVNLTPISGALYCRGWGGVGCWWQLDIRRKGKEGDIFFIDRTTDVGKSMCQMRIVLAFILSLQIHDLYPRLPEACEGFLNHIEQQE